MEPDCKNHILPSRKYLKSQIQELVNYLCKEKQVSQRLTCTERRKTRKHGIDPAEKSRIESEFPVSWEKIPHTYWLRGFCLQDRNGNSSPLSVTHTHKVYFIEDSVEHSMQKSNCDFNMKQFNFKMS